MQAWQDNGYVIVLASTSVVVSRIRMTPQSPVSHLDASAAAVNFNLLAISDGLGN